MVGFQASKTDLIALDSPFLTDALVAGFMMPNNNNFESAWNVLREVTISRGWSGCTLQEIETRVKSSLSHYQVIHISPDVPPFPGNSLCFFFYSSILIYLSIYHRIGETKFIISDAGNPAIPLIDGGVHAAIRLRSEEDGSALWQIRCSNAELKTTLLNILNV
jgi:AP-4 complex subunit epsilon-1